MRNTLSLIQSCQHIVTSRSFMFTFYFQLIQTGSFHFPKSTVCAFTFVFLNVASTDTDVIAKHWHFSAILLDVV